MSNIRFNEKELLYYAVTHENATAQGPVKKKSKKYKHQSLWLVLKGNLLFVFKSSAAPQEEDVAHSCYVLESCYPEVTDTGFSITFKDVDKDRILSFMCHAEYSKEWVRFVKEANFKHLRNQLMYYKSILKKISCTSSSSSYDSLNMYQSKQFIVLITLQGLICSQYQCEVQVRLTNSEGNVVLYSEGVTYSSNEMKFHTSCILSSNTFRDIYFLSIYRTSHAAKQPCFIKICSIPVCFADTILPDAVSGEFVAPIEAPNASGIASLLLVNSSDMLDSVVKHSNHRSSCLFTDTIQPLALDEKDDVFSAVFSRSLSRHFALCSQPPADMVLIEESILSLSSTAAVTTSFLSFLLAEDRKLLEVVSKLPEDVIDHSNLQFRIDVNGQHLTSLTQTTRASLRRSGYHTLYRPSNLCLYRAKIMDSGSKWYEIFDKVLLSSPTKNTDASKEGGLNSMLANEHVKTGFDLCKRYSTLRDKVANMRTQLQGHLDRLTSALANFDTDGMERHWSDIEVLANSLVSVCTSAEVADLVISLSSLLGEECPLWVWVEKQITYIEPSWSVWPVSRSIAGQVEAISEQVSSFAQDFRSDLWVELLFLPAITLQRDLLALIDTSLTALDFKIHLTQNSNAPMNRFVMRSDAVMGQLLLALASAFYSAVYTYMDDVFFWLQLLNVGFFVQVEALLSYHGSEKRLLEDLSVAVMLLRSARLEIVCAEEGRSTPYFTGSRYTPVLCVPVPVRIYALLLDVCQSHSSNRKISIHPSLCDQVLSRTEGGMHAEAEAAFIQKINRHSLDYVSRVLEANTAFYHNIEDTGKLGALRSVVEELGRRWEEPPGEVLTLYHRLGKHLCAGQIVVCSTGLDNSAMSVTYALHRQLEEQHGVGEGASLLKALRQGVLFERAGQVRSYSHYVLSGDMHEGFFC